MFGSYRDTGTKEYQLKQKAVENIVYNYSQVAGKKGVLNQASYDALVKELTRFGDFEIILKAEKFEQDGTKTIVDGDSVIDYDLRTNDYDLITIYVENKDELFINKVYATPPMGIDTNYTLYARGCSYIE